MAFFMTVVNTDITTVRSLYKSAIDNSKKADELVKTCSTKANSSALYRAYYGSGIAFQAKHSWSPASKLSKAKAAAKELNKAVQLAPNDLEVRFLRFSFEYSIPDFLEMSEHLQADKKWILANKNTNHAIWATIKGFLKECNLLTTAEKNAL